MPTQTRAGADSGNKSARISGSSSEFSSPTGPPCGQSRSGDQNTQKAPRDSSTGVLRSPPPPPPSVEAQLADIRIMIRNLAASVDSCRDSLSKRVDSLEVNIKTEIKQDIKQLQEYVDINIAQVMSRVEAVEGKVDAIQQQQQIQENKEYDPEVTVVAIGLHYEEDEEIHDKVSHMLRRGLGIRDMPVVRAKRMSRNGNRPGIVKIQLRSLDDKKKVLRAKSELKNTHDFSRVYLRSAFTHAERLMDLNFRTLLKKIPGCQNMRITGNGRLIEREDTRQNINGLSSERRHQANEQEQ